MSGLFDFFCKNRKKSRVPLDGLPARLLQKSIDSTFAKFCKSQNRNLTFAKDKAFNFSYILSYIMLKKTDRSILDGIDTMMMRTGI